MSEVLIQIKANHDIESIDVGKTVLLDDKYIYTQFYIYDDISSDQIFDWHLAGQIKWQHVDVEAAIQKDLNAYLFCSEHGLHVAQCYVDLQRPSSNFLSATEKKYLRYSVAKQVGQSVLKNNLAFIDRFEILPKYRGMGIGKQVFDLMLRRVWRDVKIVMLYPYPLQFAGNIGCRNDEDRQFLRNMRYCELSNDFKTANNAILKFYKKIGFQKIRNSNYIYCINEFY